MIDTGLRSAAENIAFNRALLEAHQHGEIPNTLRFLRFRPSALVGFHQSVDQELCVEYCRENGITIQRRVTGGGAIYFDEDQIGWELYLHKKTLGTADMVAVARRVCEMAAAGISRLGVNARFRPRNDIEVEGRKISGTGGAFDGDSILYQGTLLIDFDVERMLRVLRIPAEKLSDKAVASARERVANLKDLLGRIPGVAEVQHYLISAFAEGFGVDFNMAADLGELERIRFSRAMATIDSDEWVWQVDRPVCGAPIVEGVHKAEGGLLRVALAVDRSTRRLKQVWLTGDFFVDPRRMIVDLEAALRDTALDDYQRNIHRFFDRYRVEMLLLRPEDFVKVLEAAIRRLDGSPEQGAQSA